MCAPASSHGVSMRRRSRSAGGGVDAFAAGLATALRVTALRTPAPPLDASRRDGIGV